MKSTGRILTTHVGSLVRPPELVAFLRVLMADARDEADAGTPADEVTAGT